MIYGKVFFRLILFLLVISCTKKNKIIYKNNLKSITIINKKSLDTLETTNSYLSNNLIDDINNSKEDLSKFASRFAVQFHYNDGGIKILGCNGTMFKFEGKYYKLNKNLDTLLSYIIKNKSYPK